MQKKYLSLAAELKSVDEAGTVEGYGSVFGNVDSYGDVVAKGAFDRTLREAKEAGRMPAMLWQHNPDEPIGVWTEMAEDDRGLLVRGRLADTQRGREAQTLIKMGALTGLSIGYVTKSSRVDKTNGATVLTDVDLWEVSPVTFPANGEARITDAKSVNSVRDFEEFLRNAGFSRAAAKSIAANGYQAIQREVDADSEAMQREVAAEEKSDDEILTAIAALRSKLK